ncbi:DUF4468 domain-containing protein [Spirosoma validum]|uniref:DUF4468 domain-containing protein n=1 Tax=Spirosoma validum TaxID=2771355 RepID=A0A927B1I0_9BACT|nr:DUF4468 domain-containing protein [Spirosoma validum]MBD2753829.1 DUF4468 domain-containing protein [Spirosoma validum]
MKQLILIIFWLGPYCLYGQNYMMPVDPQTNKITYSDVVDIKNKKDILFKNAQTWITKSFGDYKAVIQFEDKEAGRLIIKGVSSLDVYLFDRIRYVITIDCKDNKYRCVLTDLERGASVLPPISYLPVSQLDATIKSLQDELKLIDLKIQNETKKSVRKQWVDVKSKTETSLSMDINFVEQTNNKAKELLSSLKKAMAVNDDF